MHSGARAMRCCLGKPAMRGSISWIYRQCLSESCLAYWATRRWMIPTSALLSGLIVAFILGPQEPWIAVAWVAAFASISKQVLATRREHIFNPAALALLGSALFLSSGQSWWGSLGDAPGPFTLVLIACGVFIVDRLNKFGLVLAFLATYFVAFTMASIFDAASVAEMFRSPFVQSALFLALLMLTDPPTSPNRLSDQVWYGVVAAAGGSGQSASGSRSGLPAAGRAGGKCLAGRAPVDAASSTRIDSAGATSRAASDGCQTECGVRCCGRADWHR